MLKKCKQKKKSKPKKKKKKHALTVWIKHYLPLESLPCSLIVFLAVLRPQSSSE